MTNHLAALKKRVHALNLWGILAQWDAYATKPWLAELVEIEEAQRIQRSLQRRYRAAKLGSFRALSEFDWAWPREIERDLIEELFSLNFVPEAYNVIFIGQSGVGKTMLAKNLAHQALTNGYRVVFVTAMAMLTDLGAQDSSRALERRLAYYARPDLLVVDEVGYLAATAEHADLFFEVVTRRYEKKPLLITSNRPFPQWNETFPNAACVVALVDRIIHRAHIITIDADSYRCKEAQEAISKRTKKRAATPRRSRAKR